MTGFNALPIAGDDFNDAETKWEGVPKILGPRWAQLPVLSVGLLGVQVLWSIEMSYAPPYLVNLGLSRSWMSMVLLAGPLSGLIVQPLVGVMADNCKSRFGRRRPYMLVGTLLSSLSMLLLGFTRGFASIFTIRGSVANEHLTIALAILAVFCIDFSINVVQAVDRALIVDSLPMAMQPAGNAWAARILGVGAVLGFFFGNVDLTGVFWFLGETELEVLSVIAVFLLVSSQGTTAAFVKERILVSSSRSVKGFRDEIRDIWGILRNLPRTIRQICIIQFLAWIAWYPILFLTTSYIGELYRRSTPEPQTDAEVFAQRRTANLLGSRALFFFAIATLFANFVMPLFVLETKGEEKSSGGTKLVSLLERCRVLHLCQLWAFSHLLTACCMGATLFTSSVYGVTILLTLTGFSWAITQWAPYSLLGEQILLDSSTTDGYDDSASIHLLDVRSRRRSSERSAAGADVIWDESDERQQLIEVGQLAPDNDGDTDSDFVDVQPHTKETTEGPTGGERRSSLQDDETRTRAIMGNADARLSLANIQLAHGNGHIGLQVDDENSDRANALDGADVHPRPKPKGLQEKSGIILGVHNLFIVIPQILITGVSSLVFALFDSDTSGLHGNLGKVDTMPANGTATAVTSADLAPVTNVSLPRLLLHVRGEARTGPNAVAIIFRLGGISTVAAFILCWRLARELKRPG